MVNCCTDIAGLVRPCSAGESLAAHFLTSRQLGSKQYHVDSSAHLLLDNLSAEALETQFDLCNRLHQEQPLPQHLAWPEPHPCALLGKVFSFTLYPERQGSDGTNAGPKHVQGRAWHAKTKSMRTWLAQSPHQLEPCLLSRWHSSLYYACRLDGPKTSRRAAWMAHVS